MVAEVGGNPREAANAGRMGMTRGRHVPTRSCVVCAIRAPKRELDRIVASVDGCVWIDPTGKMRGRGTYICKNPSCDTSTLRRGRLEYTLRTEISDDNWAQLVASIVALGTTS